MDNEERAALIRRGNELFNLKDFKNALKIFLATNYKDGITRVADHLYYEEHQSISAIKLYKKAGMKRKVEDFAEKAAFTIRLLLEEDQKQEDQNQTEKAQKSAIQEWKPMHIKSEEIMGEVIQGEKTEKLFSKKIPQKKSDGDKS